MQLFDTLIHPELNRRTGYVLRRQAVRGVVLRESQILLLFTERYNDFSLPGGGVDDGETLEAGLRRELAEETGARDIEVHNHWGYLEEYRPHWKPQYDLVHMTSHFFQCSVAPELAAAKMEGYELANGMKPLWVDVNDALNHNRAVMQSKEKTMGQSIQRETFILEKIATELLAAPEAA